MKSIYTIIIMLILCLSMVTAEDLTLEVTEHEELSWWQKLFSFDSFTFYKVADEYIPGTTVQFNYAFHISDHICEGDMVPVVEVYDPDGKLIAEKRQTMRMGSGLYYDFVSSWKIPDNAAYGFYTLNGYVLCPEPLGGLDEWIVFSIPYSEHVSFEVSKAEGVTTTCDVGTSRPYCKSSEHKLLEKKTYVNSDGDCMVSVQVIEYCADNEICKVDECQKLDCDKGWVGQSYCKKDTNDVYRIYQEAENHECISGEKRYKNCDSDELCLETATEAKCVKVDSDDGEEAKDQEDERDDEGEDRDDGDDDDNDKDDDTSCWSRVLDGDFNAMKEDACKKATLWVGVGMVSVFIIIGGLMLVLGTRKGKKRK